MELVEIQTTDSFGDAVVAKMDLTPGSLGLEVFREEALIVFPPHNNNKNVRPAPWGQTNMLFEQHFWPDYLYFLEQPEDIQEKVLSFYAEMDCEDGRLVYEFVNRYLESSESAKRFTRFFLVIKFNAVTCHPVSPDGSGPGHYHGRGLFQVACRMAHSCRPNCLWFSSQDGQSKIVRAIAPIKEGEMLTITYVDSKYLEKPMCLRREVLKRVKNFDCMCNRCTLLIGGDDSRCFRCHNKRCNGLHRVRQVDIESSSELLACNVCGSDAPETFQDRMLELEEEVTRKIDYVDRVTDLGLPIDVTGTIRSLKPPHQRHGIAIRIYQAQAELFEQLGQLPKAILAQRKLINCRLRIHGDDYCDEITGFGYERLGDLLNQGGDWEGSERAYQRAVQALQIARGGSSDPYTKCAITKLTLVQNLIINNNLKPTAITSNKCGLCGILASKKCGRCGAVVYCNRDHQTAHWKVHKKSCK